MSPIAQCGIHREIEVDVETGLRACRRLPGQKVTEVHEFWPSDIAVLYRKAGLPRRRPPPWHPACGIDERIDVGQVPEITSPRRGYVYNVRVSPSQTGKHDRIPLSATTDADVKELFWFAGNEFLGRAPNTKPLFWRARPGKYNITAIDDAGRSASRDVEIHYIR